MRIFTNPSTGQRYKHPPTKAEAISLSLPFYNDEGNTCLGCNHPDPVRYTSDDTCRKCLIEGTGGYNDQLKNIDWNKYTLRPHGCKGGPHLVKNYKGTTRCATCDETLSPRQEALAASETWYMPDKFCPKCGTLSLKRVQDGACKGCQDLIPLKAPSPRQVAIAARDAWYMPDHHCIKCGKQALKRVANGECQGCTGIVTLAEAEEILADGFRIGRKAAKGLGLLVYRTDCIRSVHNGRPVVD